MNEISREDELELEAINSGRKTPVAIPYTKKTYNIGYMKGSTHEKLSILELLDGIKDEADSKKVVKKRTRLLAKASSYCILNGVKMYLFHWFFWRYLYYYKGYTYEQLEPIVETAKKKVGAVSYYKATTYLKMMKVTGMAMTQEEQIQLRAELSLE